MKLRIPSFCCIHVWNEDVNILCDSQGNKADMGLSRTSLVFPKQVETVLSTFQTVAEVVFVKIKWVCACPIQIKSMAKFYF